MTKPNTHHSLNRLLTIVYRSLPMYLTFANPWTQRSDAPAVTALRNIVDDQQQLSNRIAEYILDNHHGPIEMGEYPLDFPDTHDLSLDYLLKKLVVCQKADIEALESVVADLQQDRHAAVLAEEALGAARGHLETLQELTGETVKAGV